MPNQGTAVHWTVNAPPADHGGCLALVQQIAQLHYSKGSSGFTFYNWLFCNHGQRIQGRGWAKQSGANGTSAANRDYWAASWIGGPGHTPNAAAFGVLQGIVDEAPGAKRARPHSDFYSTACPGDDLRAWCRRYQPGVSPPTASAPYDLGETEMGNAIIAEGHLHVFWIDANGKPQERWGHPNQQSISQVPLKSLDAYPLKPRGDVSVARNPAKANDYAVTFERDDGSTRVAHRIDGKWITE